MPVRLIHVQPLVDAVEAYVAIDTASSPDIAAVAVFLTAALGTAALTSDLAHCPIDELRV